jgi:predicted ribosome quality control (RQC) complex YloA/Tae2 family protein
MDAFLVRQVVTELSAELLGGLVSRIHQPADREIVLTLWTGRGEKRLLLSADRELCRLHITARKVPNPPSPPRFCQFLRRHLEGMRIEKFSAAPFDRLVRIDFVSTRPDPVHRRTALHAELYGRHANLIYVDDDGVILEALQNVSAQESRVREVRAGVPFRPLPPPGRAFLPEITQADCERILSADAGETLPRTLQNEISGLGRELAYEAAERGQAGAAALHGALRELVRRYGEDVSPGIGTLRTGKKRLLPFPCPAAGFVGFVAFPSANAAADAYYTELAGAREVLVLRQQLASRIRALLSKERHTLDNIGGDEERMKEGLLGGERGEKLKSALAQLRKGMIEFEGIHLDPSLSPVENMNRYFRRYKKAKGAVEIVRKRRREVGEAAYYLESLESQVEAAGTAEELFSIRRELSLAYPPKRRPETGKGRKKEAGKPVEPQVLCREFHGYTIFVGKNNFGNDRIVKELAAPDDLWLHAQGIPGSHVLVQAQRGKEVPPEVISEAARLAVFHSKARGSANVPVFLAFARHVSKFKGAKPGLVRIAKFRTINIR